MDDKAKLYWGGGADCTPLLLYCAVIIRGIHDDREEALKFRSIHSLETTQVLLIAFYI